MNLLEKITYLMNENGLNKRTLSQASGVPYTTIDGLYKKGYEGARMSTIKSLASFFGVTLDSFCRDDIDELQYAYQKPDISLSPAEHQLIINYRSINTDGQERLLDYADDLVQSGKYKKSSFTQMVDKNA